MLVIRRPSLLAIVTTLTLALAALSSTACSSSTEPTARELSAPSKCLDCTTPSLPTPKPRIG